jgi:hypothetical protein
MLRIISRVYLGSCRKSCQIVSMCIEIAATKRGPRIPPLTRFRAALIAGSNRPFWLTASVMLAASAASTMSNASRYEAASGFCASTCLPAAITRCTSEGWTLAGRPRQRHRPRGRPAKPRGSHGHGARSQGCRPTRRRRYRTDRVGPAWAADPTPRLVGTQLSTGRLSPSTWSIHLPSRRTIAGTTDLACCPDPIQGRGTLSEG